MSNVRPPAVAGQFYPADAKTLSKQVLSYLAEASEDVHAPPKALIAPHAGYVYSGLVAAHAYAHILPLKGVVKRVVLLGPCHRVAVQGVALSSADAFLTPLGSMPIDHSLDEQLLELPGVHVFDATHANEHSLEVHIPFLQSILDDFALIPMVVGAADAVMVANILDAVWGGPETLIVISSDLSHYLDYDSAKALDQQTCSAIEQLDWQAIGNKQACGRMPVKGLLELAKRKGLEVRTLDLRNSGDTAGTKKQVVGYGSWGFWEREHS
ncbi:AmmeMemoRadiSam system protein B [Magnetovibrio sp. PR-2]|uniref:AmmeMemoRadiSam system protein B n=1 Tax=Magnetovibrio sp. PR-2 TaxID=3120356 RepID=UPI002FCDE6A8